MTAGECIHGELHAARLAQDIYEAAIHFQIRASGGLLRGGRLQECSKRLAQGCVIPCPGFCRSVEFTQPFYNPCTLGAKIKPANKEKRGMICPYLEISETVRYDLRAINLLKPRAVQTVPALNKVC